MKKNLFLLLIASVAVLAACTKENADDQIRPTTSGYPSTSYDDPTGDDHGCNGGGQQGGNTASAMVVDFTIDNVNGKVDEQINLILNNKTVNAMSYSWDFGNGDTSTEVNPKYSYKIHGNYTVTLTATDQRGNVSKVSKDVTVLCIFGGGDHES
jgi:PKD repeat protein